MKYIKNYNKLFESSDNQFFKTKEEIKEWLHSKKNLSF